MTINRGKKQVLSYNCATGKCDECDALICANDYQVITCEHACHDPKRTDLGMFQNG